MRHLTYDAIVDKHTFIDAYPANLAAHPPTSDAAEAGAASPKLFMARPALAVDFSLFGRVRTSAPDLVLVQLVAEARAGRRLVVAFLRLLLVVVVSGLPTDSARSPRSTVGWPAG
jgi:hypothetical protein